MFLKCLPIAILMSFLSACDRAKEEEVEAYNNNKEVEAYYKANPERFVFSTLDALPSNLNWQDGSDLETFGDPRAKRGGQLTLRLRSMQQTLRIVGPDANGSLRAPLWSANTVNLIHRHPWQDAFIPGIAKKWALDPDDNLTVYLKLDPDARWSDDTKVTADDILFSLYFLLSPHINDPAINRVMDENFTAITRFDSETFSITQTKATPDLLSGISSFILSQSAFYQEFGPDYVDRYHWRFAPVTGPYRLDESKVDRGRKITFDRIDNWWANSKPFYKHRFNPDRMTYFVIRDDSKAFESFLKGDVDWHFLDQTSLWYDRADSEPIQNGYIERAWVYHNLPTGSGGIHMNALHPMLVDKNVRLGIQHAINYEKVNSGLYRGDKRRIKSFADGYGAYSHPTLKARQSDPVKAEAYFNKAGFINRGSDGILVNDNNQRLSIVLTLANRSDEPTQATILKEEALKAGLEIVIEMLDSTAYFTKVFAKKHQIALHGWNNGYSALPPFEWEIRGKDAGLPDNFNTTNIKDAELDTLLAEWDSLADPISAQLVSHKVQERIHEFAAWVPGLVSDYDRLGYWRWIRWPKYFQVPTYFFFNESGVYWIEEESKQETLDAKKAKQKLPPVTKTYDRWQ